MYDSPCSVIYFRFTLSGGLYDFFPNFCLASEGLILLARTIILVIIRRVICINPVPGTYIITNLYNKLTRWRFSFRNLTIWMSELKNWVQSYMTKLELKRQHSGFLNLSLSFHCIMLWPNATLDQRVFVGFLGHRSQSGMLCSCMWEEPLS